MDLRSLSRSVASMYQPSYYDSPPSYPLKNKKRVRKMGNGKINERISLTDKPSEAKSKHSKRKRKHFNCAIGSKSEDHFFEFPHQHDAHRRTESTPSIQYCHNPSSNNNKSRVVIHPLPPAVAQTTYQPMHSYSDFSKNREFQYWRL